MLIILECLRLDAETRRTLPHRSIHLFVFLRPILTWLDPKAPSPILILIITCWHNINRMWSINFDDVASIVENLVDDTVDHVLGVPMSVLKVKQVSLCLLPVYFQLQS